MDLRMDKLIARIEAKKPPRKTNPQAVEEAPQSKRAHIKTIPIRMDKLRAQLQQAGHQ